MGGHLETNLAHRPGKTYLIYGRRERAPSFIIRSRHFFVFEVTRYVSAPSRPRRVLSEMAPHRGGSAALYCEGDHGCGSADPCDRFAAGNGNFNAFKRPIVLNLRSLGPSLLTAPPLEEKLPPPLSIPPPTPTLVWSSSLQHLCATNLHQHSNRQHLFSVEKKPGDKRLLMKRPNKTETHAPAPGLELKTFYSMVIHRLPGPPQPRVYEN